MPYVKFVQTAASSLSNWRQKLIQDAFPEAQFLWGFGMTETCVTTIKNRYTQDLVDHPGSMGYVWRHVAYRLVDENGTVLTEPGATGELQVKGPTVFKGYWRQDALNAETMDEDGWFSTGDLMRFDDREFAYFMGRSKDMVKTGGENVASLEVETRLVEHPSVSQAAVFGIPHEYWGEELVAAVIRRPGASLDAEDLRLWCREQLSGFKVPKRIFFVDSLPMSSSGKIQKFVLTKRFTDQSDVAELGT